MIKMKLIAKVGVASFAVATVAAGTYAAYQYGKVSCENYYLEELNKARQEQQQAIDRLARAQESMDRVDRQITQEVMQVLDPSGCGDVDIPDGVLNSLPRARPKTD